MIVSGTILCIIDETHILFETTTGDKLWVAVLTSFKYGNLGQFLTLDIIERYEIQSIVKNENGRYKLIDISNTIEGTPVLTFIDKKNNATISGHMPNNLKTILYETFQVGSFFDLSLIDCYKGINNAPNLPGNKNSSNEEVLLLNFTQERHYLALYQGKTISLSCSDDEKQYLGSSFLSNVYRKYFAINISPNKKIINLPIGIFTFLNSTSKSNYMIVKDRNDSKYAYINRRGVTIPDNNQNLQLALNFAHVNFASSDSLSQDKNGRYQLLYINKFNDTKNYYFFKDETSNIFAVNFYLENNNEIITNIGSFYNFNFLQKYYLLNGESTDNTINSYLLETILPDNLLIFSKNNQKYIVKNQLIEVSPSKTGNYYNLNFIPIIYGNVYDANSPK
jgi:hypothetical protein